MDLILTGVGAGVVGTLAMDLLNHLFARTGMLTKIDVGMIGRMAVGWIHGRFCYEHPDEMKEAAEEIKATGRTPFFHYTHRASTILRGPLIDEIIGDLYATFDKSLHVGFIVPYTFQSKVETEILGYGQ